MRVSIVCVGKLKEKYLKDACLEYIKRINRFCSIDIIEISDEKAPEKLSASQEQEIKAKETNKILSKIRPNSFLIVLDLQGKQLSSVEFSKRIESCMLSGSSDITFVIGGSLGLDMSVLKGNDLSICLSEMTFPHQLVRVILLEQIFRAFKIINGETYHK